jgi:hypothetical protein
MKASPVYGPRAYMWNGVQATPPKSVTPDAAQTMDGEKLKLVEREILKQLLIEQGNLAKVRKKRGPSSEKRTHFSTKKHFLKMTFYKHEKIILTLIQGMELVY